MLATTFLLKKLDDLLFYYVNFYIKIGGMSNHSFKAVALPSLANPSVNVAKLTPIEAKDAVKSNPKTTASTRRISGEKEQLSSIQY